MDSREIRELLSACRPDRSDLTAEQLRAVDAALNQDDELREQWAASQEWDAQLQAAFVDVPVPAGLADRLLAATSAQDPEQTVVPPPTRQWSRRAILSIGVGAAALILVAVSLAFWRWHDPLTTEVVVDEFRAWVEKIDQAGWRSDDMPTVDYPLDPGLALYNVTWQRLDLPYDSEAVVYRGELAPDHSTATLYVVKTRHGKALRDIPPTKPDSSTGGQCIGVWKSQGNLYVLVVPGSPSDYLKALSQAYA